VHFRRRDAQGQRIRGQAALETFEGREEKRAVLPVVQTPQLHRPAPGPAEIVLPVHPLLRLEESLPVQRVVAEKVVDRPVKRIRSGLRRKRDGAAGRLTEFWLEAVGLDGELRDSFD